MSMREWENGSGMMPKQGAMVAGFTIVVLLSLSSWMLVNVNSLSDCPSNYKIINFPFEVPYLRSSSLVALCDRDLFLLPVSGRKISLLFFRDLVC